MTRTKNADGSTTRDPMALSARQVRVLAWVLSQGGKAECPVTAHGRTWDSLVERGFLWRQPTGGCALTADGMRAVGSAMLDHLSSSDAFEQFKKVMRSVLAESKSADEWA